MMNCVCSTFLHQRTHLLLCVSLVSAAVLMCRDPIVPTVTAGLGSEGVHNNLVQKCMQHCKSYVLLPILGCIIKSLFPLSVTGSRFQQLEVSGRRVWVCPSRFTILSLVECCWRWFRCVLLDTGTVQSLSNQTESFVCIAGSKSDSFPMDVGLHSGCSFSDYLHRVSGSVGFRRHLCFLQMMWYRCSWVGRSRYKKSC